jgi:tetratricopeptide (TPR) repeat protein
MEKILKPYTIIPEELYVQRDADKQVRNIIADMGRPGYVLVSRQMGKTNLLLNAKSKLETTKDAFVYIDLSNTFPTAKGCFENIIDNAIEAYADKFEDVAKIILERRTELKDTPAHKQHTNELRFLLQALNGGKLVIILDEIDALTKTDYSDQIFSQVRSTYFGARVNYKEFYNLTYLLSGVVEPNEIIKDPKVSPFNIGQKIYLNDFSRIEFDEFLKTAKLNIDQLSADRIFYWTNGNPRISWDVCSEVENKLKSKECNLELIDKIIQDLYLTSFDKAPIDNIREIVSNDREIRNSIVEIEYKKGKLVSDKIKSKLYLAGIINYDEDDIHIKNEVIRRSLSYDWIRTLEEQDKGLINLAMEEYQNLKYSNSLQSFEKYLENNEFDESPNRFHYYYIMGHCAFSLLNYEKAIEYFEKADFDSEDEAIWYYKVLNQKGLTYFYLNRIEESLFNLKKVIDNGKKDSLYARALLNYGSISLKSDKTAHKSEAINIFNEIINETAFKKERIKEAFINELKSIAHYNLAQIQNFEGDIVSSISNYKYAISLGKEMNKPRFILALLKINKNKEENNDYLKQLIDSIISSSISPKDEDPERPMDFNYDEFRQICLLAFTESKNDLFNKIEPHLSKLGEQSKWKHLYELAVFSINEENSWDKALIILNYIYESMNSSTESIEDESKYNTLKLLAYGTDRNEAKGYDIEYINLFKKNRLYPIDFFDMEIFINLIFFLTGKRQFDEALKYANIIVSLKETSPEHNLINYLVVYHLQLNIYSYKNDRANSLLKAEQILELANNKKVQKQKSHLLGDTGMDIIKQNAEAILRPKEKNIIPVKSSKVYGRNQILKVRYKDGTILETKFKKIEKDIFNGDCMVLE